MTSPTVNPRYPDPMPIPEFIVNLRRHIGTAPLWLSGVSAVVFREGEAGDEILLVKRADNGLWSPVAGIIDPGEEPYEAALREVEEEAGVRAEIERLIWVNVTRMVTYANGDQTQYINHTFRCRWVAGEPHPADGEASEARFFPLDALPPLVGEHADRVRVALEDQPETRLGPLG